MSETRSPCGGVRSGPRLPLRPHAPGPCEESHDGVSSVPLAAGVGGFVLSHWPAGVRIECGSLEPHLSDGLFLFHVENIEARLCFYAGCGLHALLHALPASGRSKASGAVQYVLVTVALVGARRGLYSPTARL